MNDINWQEQLEQIMEKAGEILLFYWGKQLKETAKPQAGFVTEADLESERYLVEALTNLFQADIWAEESGKSEKYANGYRWVIDPLDGTTNFVRHIPYFCISVALTYHDEPQVAAIYTPLFKQFFFAQKGKGAWLNGKSIQVANPAQFSDAFVAVGIPYKGSERAEIITYAAQIGIQARTIRHLGAVALDMANVAAGNFDGLFFSHLGWWDVAAGMLLIQEAGGRVTNFNGEPITPAYVSCLSGGKMVFERLLALLSDK